MSDLGNLPVLCLTTTGRKTGLPREIEIWFVHSDGKLFLLAEHYYRAQWVQNILQNRHVRVKLGGRAFSATARVLDPERDYLAWNLARRLAAEKYGWGDGLPVEIAPDQPLA